MAALVLGLTRTIVSPAFLGPSMVGAILGAWGLARALGVSSILACTFAGMAVSNIRHASANSAEAYLKPLGGLLFAAFYTLAGFLAAQAQVLANPLSPLPMIVNPEVRP